MRVEKIGLATLYLGDCREILPSLENADHIITDPPYSAKTHKGHDDGTKFIDGSSRIELGYNSLTKEAACEFGKVFSSVCGGWVVWLTDHILMPPISDVLESCGRYVFAPLPYYHAGRSVRLTGDGPCSWTDWIVVSRTAAQKKWGTLPGGYIANAGWNDKVRMGGKPTALMKCLVNDYSCIGELVCDPFMGAGTTGVAAVMLKRKFVGIEIDPEAFDISCNRIEAAQRQYDMFLDASQ